MTRRRATFVSLTLMLATAAAPAPAGDQPQWGQRANIKWSVRLGSETHSTPVIAGGRIFIGTNNNRPRDPRHKGDRGVLMCLDEKDGRLLWQLVVPKLNGDPHLDWPRSGICSPADEIDSRFPV